MAINTEARRRSISNLGSPWRDRAPIPDGTIGQGDRQSLLTFYSGILWSGTIVSPIPTRLPSLAPRTSTRKPNLMAVGGDVPVVIKRNFDELRVYFESLPATFYTTVSNHASTTGNPHQTYHTQLFGVGADQHHNQVHTIDGTDHTGSLDADEIIFVPVGDLSATDVQGALEELDSEKSAISHTHTHAATTGQTTDDHHAQSHAHDGVDGSGTVAHSHITGQTTDDHHAQQHAIDGADHTGTLDHSEINDDEPNQHIDWTAASENLDTSGNVTGGELYSDGLTSGRMVFVGASGILRDSANLTFDAGATKILSAISHIRVNSDTYQLQLGADQDMLVYFDGTDGWIDTGGAQLKVGDAGGGTYVQVDDAGDLFFVGSGSGLPFGSMYADDIAETVTVAASGTWYEVDGGNFTVGQVNLASLDSAYRIQVTKAGTYMVVWGMSVETGAAAQYIEGAVAVNGTANVQTIGTTETATASKKYQISGTGILSLSASDFVSLAVSNETATQDIVVSHGNLSLVMVGA